MFSAIDAVRSPVPGPRILILHQVGAGHGYQLDLSIDDFRSQLGWLAANTQVVSLDEALDRSAEPDAGRLTVLTFDDGYRDVYENAFPLLKRLQLPFTIYVTARPIERQEPLQPRPKSEPLSWDQINEMNESGLLTIAGHTYDHEDLRHQAADHIASDLDRCDDLIEKRTGIRVEHFAYPYGYWSPTADPIVRQRYASAALGATPEPLPANDGHLVHRIPIQLSDGTFFFRRKMARGLRAEERVRRLLTRYGGP